MRPSNICLGKEIEKKLLSFVFIHPLPGIKLQVHRTCFIEQIIDSIRRIQYVNVIANKITGEAYADTTKIFFDPLRAAVWHKQNENIDEAFWLTFLSIHFGKNKATKWSLLRNVYHGEGAADNWTWEKTSSNPRNFRQWLSDNQSDLKINGNFGNHRKYESLNGLKHNGTGAAIESYIDWVGPNHNHQSMIENIVTNENPDPKVLFSLLYKSMSSVTRFGRTAKFDYLTMLGKIGLADIVPPSTYMVGATGPVSGANLLFTGNVILQKSIPELDNLLIELESHLGLFFGMQVLEDALCNWQKSPEQYIHFVG